MVTSTTFTDDFTCNKKSPESDVFTIHNKGSFEAETPGKMVESLGPASPPYWVIGLWDAGGSLVEDEDPDGDSYSFALVYACVGSPLFGEYTCASLSTSCPIRSGTFADFSHLSSSAPLAPPL